MKNWNVSRRSGSGGGDLREEIARNRTLIGTALAILGMGTLVSIGLLTFTVWRVAREGREVRADSQRALQRLEAVTTELIEQRRRLNDQREELVAIRKVADEDLQAIREAQRKLVAATRDPRRELEALREANEALWTELAKQRSQLLDALDDGGGSEAGENGFRLGETAYLDPREDPDAIRGFVKGDEKVFRATAVPANPAHLVIEVSPENIRPGDTYHLTVRLVNRSNRPLETSGLRLDWSFGGGRNTGGAVPIEPRRVSPRASVVLHEMSGRWTPSHAEGSAKVTATLTLDGGERLSNTLSW